MSTQEKENQWGYAPADEVTLSVAVPSAVGVIIAIAALMYVPTKKKSLTDIVKNISYSITSLLILNLTSASMIAYIANMLSLIALNYLVAHNCNSAFDQSQSCLNMSTPFKI